MAKLTRDEVQARISVLLNSHVGVTSTEADYIIALEEPYQELAIYQAAYGQATRMMMDQAIQYSLRKKIDELGKIAQAYEVDAVNTKKAWADKYGNLQYKTVGGKVTAMLPPDTQPWKDFICDTCGDTGKLKQAYSLKEYPCSCEKGNQYAKDTGYMGPAVSTTKKPKQLDVYYDKKFVENLKANTGKLMTPVSNVVNIDKAQQEKADKVIAQQKAKQLSEKQEQVKQLQLIEKAISAEKEKLKPKKKGFLGLLTDKDKADEVKVDQLENIAQQLQAQINQTYGNQIGGALGAQLGIAPGVGATVAQYFEVGQSITVLPPIPGAPARPVTYTPPVAPEGRKFRNARKDNNDTT